MKSKSILLTYCANGQFKRTLKEIGFDVEVLEGPPGKKEIVRASK
jgi:tRNA U34 5-methylaminomethyl-2-thiouridine-forming methyltransferase MnmC